MKKNRLIFFLLLVMLSNGDISIAQVVNSSSQVYMAGDNIFWHLTGTGNGPAISLKQHTYQGGAQNRRGALSWMDNNNQKTEVLSWTDALNVGIGVINPSVKLHIQQNQNYGEAVVDVIKISPVLSGGNASIPTSLGSIMWNDINGSNAVAKINVVADKLSESPATHFEFWTINKNYVTSESLRISSEGNIGIGTSLPAERLEVNGNIKTKKLIIKQTGWPDYVFDASYSLRSLSEVENFIRKNTRLPDMPSAKEVEEKGISIGDNQALLLKKIEELTLYVIDLQKQINQLKNTSNKK